MEKDDFNSNLLEMNKNIKDLNILFKEFKKSSGRYNAAMMTIALIMFLVAIENIFIIAYQHSINDNYNSLMTGSLIKISNNTQMISKSMDDMRNILTGDTIVDEEHYSEKEYNLLSIKKIYFLIFILVGVFVIILIIFYINKK